jgi:hypothetical protein
MNSRKLFWLGAVELASFGLYLLLALRYPLGPSLANPRASWASMVVPTGINATLHLAIYLGITLLYLVTMRMLARLKEQSAAHRRQQVLMVLTAWLACSAALMTAAPGGESHDIFDYIFRGRMMTEYQANPLVDIPNDFSLSTPYSRYLAWRKNVDSYGPVWEASSAAIAIKVRQSARWLGWWDEAYPVCPKSPESCRLLIAYLTGYRLLAILMTGLGGWLIASMISSSQPSLVPLALAAWFLNPMTLVASALGAHNDALMMALVLLSWWLLQRQRPFLALLVLILAAHVKLIALIWLPVCVLWILWRWGWKRALKVSLASAISGLALSWLMYAPFGGWNSLPNMLHERLRYLANSPWRILKTLLVDYWKWPVDRAHQISIRLPSWLFGVSALLTSLWMFNFRPKRWRETQIDPSEADSRLWLTLLAVSLLYLAIGAFWFEHWYILWVIAPAVLLPDSRFTRSILPWLVFGALSANVVMDFLQATALRSTQPIVGYIVAVIVIWVPAIIATLFQSLHRRARSIEKSTADMSVWSPYLNEKKGG